LFDNPGILQINGGSGSSLSGGVLQLDPTSTFRADCSGINTDFFGPVTVNGPATMGNCPTSTTFKTKIGQEVVVDFLEGDPDQPILVTPPSSGLPPGYTAPAGWYQITVGGLTSAESIIVKIVVPFNTNDGIVYKWCPGSSPALASDANLHGDSETIVLTQGGQGDCGGSTSGINDPQAILISNSLTTPVFPLGSVLAVLAPLSALICYFVVSSKRISKFQS